MADINSQTVHNGSTVYLMIKSDVIGRAQTATFSFETGATNNYEIGTPMPTEAVIQRWQGTVNLEKTLLKAEKMHDYMKYGQDVLRQGIVDITLLNQLTNGVIISARGCTLQSGEFQVRANDFVSQTSVWTALTMSDTTNK